MKYKINLIQKLKKYIKKLTRLNITVALRVKILFGSVLGLFIIAIIYLTYNVILGLSVNFSYKLSSGYKRLVIKHDIVDRNNNVLAITVPASSIYLRPNNILNKNLAVEAIINSFNFKRENAVNIVNSKAPFVWVARNVSNNDLNKFLSFGVIGAYVEKGYMRFYPYGNYFSHIVGITNIDGKGVSGLEYNFNNYLEKEKLQLSLDVRIQIILRNALLKALEQNNAKRAFGIIVNPKTSEVLASVSLPDFDPNNRENLSLGDMFNYVTQGVFEQGSTFKLFTVAMALDSNKFQVSDRVDVSKPLVKNGYVIVDDTYLNRSINLPEILIYSSDIGSSLIASQLDVDLQKKYFSYMGLFNATTLEISEKGDSVVPNNWSDLTRITLSYGYGMAVSQATVANAFSTLVNGGYYSPLTLIKKENTNDISKYKVFNPETSEIIKRMGRLVIAKGTGRIANIEGYNIGGKTGTAELIDKKTGRYNMSRVLASVLAYFPAEDPEYLIMISVEEPKGTKSNGWSRVAARVTAPYIKEVVENIGSLFSIPKSSDGAENINRDNQEEILNFVNNTQDKQYDTEKTATNN